tara:strand:+ start:15107 stop:16549 length:1443 start_codon:yes stop_codon:yes gene_type:complete
MLTNQALNAVMLPADKLEESGRSLSPIPGTELAKLFDASITASTAASISTMDTEIAVQEMIEGSQVTDNGAVTHDEVMANSVNLVSKVVLANLDLARNHVIPTTKTLREKYQTYMERAELDIAQPVMVIPNVYHDIWSTSELHGLVTRFENVPVNQYSMRFSLPRVTGDELRAMMKTGIGQLDEMVDGWIEDMQTDKLLHAYDRIFIEGTPIGKVPGANHLTDTGLDRNDLLIAHLISIGFEEEMPDGVNADLSSLREALSNVRRQSGRAIVGILNRRERDIRQKILSFAVTNVPWEFATNKTRVTVQLNNDVYIKFLEEGGSVETIYGAALKGDRVDYNALLEKKAMYEQFYERRISLHRQEVGSKVYMAQQEAARLAMRDLVNELEEDQLPYSRSDLHAKARERLGCYEPRYFKDEVYVLRSLVCEVLYSDTNVKMVLDAMDAAEQSDPEISPRECALHATIDLIARWLASQINVNYK